MENDSSGTNLMAYYIPIVKDKTWERERDSLGTSLMVYSLYYDLAISIKPFFGVAILLVGNRGVFIFILRKEVWFYEMVW